MSGDTYRPDQEKVMEDGKIRERYVDILGHVNIKKEQVTGVLKNIKLDNFPEPDGIYHRIVKEAREEIGGALTEIFASCLANGKVPEDRRIASVVPLFKKGNRNYPRNYSLVKSSGIRPHLQYCVKFWSSHYRKDVEAM
eukprot:g45529.t1